MSSNARGRARSGASTAPKVRLGALATVVAFLAFVEYTSGFLQGYYTPMLTDIARHLRVPDADVNWLEGSQLILSALVVPALAKLGDMVGHRRILLWATGLTAAASLALPFATTFPVFLVCWTLQGFYVVWLPLEIALLWVRSRNMKLRGAVVAKAAGLLVATLELGAISGALLGGALIDTLPLFPVLLIPGLLVVVCFGVIWCGITETADRTPGRLDVVGLSLITFAILGFTGGLSLMRLGGVDSPLAWAVTLLGLVLLWPFAKWELRHNDPIIDVRMFRSPALAPVFITAALFGMSVLGSQAPLSTFMRTDPAVYGFGLGAGGFTTSLAIGCYLIGMIAGALLFPIVARRFTPRLTLTGAAALVGVGYLMFIPLHDTFTQVVTNMVIAGLGSGALVAALPAAAAAGAPEHQTGVATGLTNSTKTMGGAVASAVFGIALMHGATGAAAGAAATAGSFSGYITVWSVCGIAAFVAAALLMFIVPKNAFQDRTASPHPDPADGVRL